MSMHTGAVDVRVVGRQPELQAPVEPEVLLGDHRRVTEDRLGDGDVVDDVLVRVGEVARRGDEEERIRASRCRVAAERRTGSSPPSLPWSSRSA